ncbi:MAG: ion transporter [Myxococcales bacterium]|nr:ion transporter [Myxococcales bacterium]
MTSGNGSENEAAVRAGASPRRERLREIIFEADTPAGRAFDVALLWGIVASVVAVMLESVEAMRTAHGALLRTAEWAFTLLFTAEYLVRIYCSPFPLRYVRSFFGVVDLLAIAPTYLSIALPGSQSLIVIRALRLLRVFRVLKLAHFLGEANVLVDAMRASRHKVVVFLGTVLILVTILGSVMYLVEGADAGFTSIPRSIYWAIVTMTTVGYGDITPRTIPGQTLAAAVMILGYAIIAVPTGIVTAEIVESVRQHPAPITTRVCPHCLEEGHRPSARFCFECGGELVRRAAGPEPETQTPPAP